MSTARQAANDLARLLANERGAVADFLVALAEFERERLWEDLGYASLFDFLHRELRLSKSSAFCRKTTAQLVLRYPEVLDPLRDGRLCLSAVLELAKVMTPENRHDVLPRFFHCSKQEAKEVAAELLPETCPPLRDVITTVPAAAASRRAEASASWHGRVHPDEPKQAPIDGPSEQQQFQAQDESALPRDRHPQAHNPKQHSRAPYEHDHIEPLTAVLRRLHMTVTVEFVQKLKAARAALSHTLPAGNAAAILEAGLDLILAVDAKKKGLVKKPHRKARPSAAGRIPAHVKRIVWERDSGRCQWPLESGGICGSTTRVQIDHILPRALGGPSTLENTQLLCAHHNQLAARRIFGDVHMDRFARRTAPPGVLGHACVRPTAARIDVAPTGGP